MHVTHQGQHMPKWFSLSACVLYGYVTKKTKKEGKKWMVIGEHNYVHIEKYDEHVITYSFKIDETLWLIWSDKYGILKLW